MSPSAARTALLAVCAAQPGSTVAELARRLGVHHSTAAYHLARLASQGAVVLVRHRGRLHCFVAGRTGEAERALGIAARGRGAEVLARVGPEARRLGAIAQGLPLSKAAVYWHLCRLAALGLVAMEGPPKGRSYRLAGPPAAAPPTAAAAAATV